MFLFCGTRKTQAHVKIFFLFSFHSTKNKIIKKTFPNKKKGLNNRSRSRGRVAPLVQHFDIDRDTVLKINRRRRFRSCDNLWPPKWHTPAQSPALSEGKNFGSTDSIYFDDSIRKQHRIDPICTIFDKENYILYDDDADSIKKWRPNVRVDKFYDDDKLLSENDGKTHKIQYNTPPIPSPPSPSSLSPPTPPPRRYYYLPLDKIHPNHDGTLALLRRCFENYRSNDNINNLRRNLEILSNKIDYNINIESLSIDHNQHRNQFSPSVSSLASNFAANDERVEHKPPLKIKAKSNFSSSKSNLNMYDIGANMVDTMQQPPQHESDYNQKLITKHDKDYDDDDKLHGTTNEGNFTSTNNDTNWAESPIYLDSSPSRLEMHSDQDQFFGSIDGKYAGL